eukprot:SAG31_NODE_535_length_14348_cov_11.339603_13_plen_75_part_00
MYDNVIIFKSFILNAVGRSVGLEPMYAVLFPPQALPELPTPCSFRTSFELMPHQKQVRAVAFSFLCNYPRNTGL